MLDMLGDSGNATVTAHRALEAIRTHLGMEVAYITEFVGDLSVIIESDAPGLEHAVVPGSSRPLADLYCLHILAGRLPGVIGDTADFEVARDMPFTHEVPVGSYMSVPVRRDDGSVLGMFCCLSPHTNTSLNQRDLQVMEAFADIAGRQIASDYAARRTHEERHAGISAVMADGGFEFALQPMWDLSTRQITDFEVLCRFTPQPYRSPDLWFKDAFDVGLGVDLESTVLGRAVGQLSALPDNVGVSVNSSPEAVLRGGLDSIVNLPFDLTRVVLEITEQLPVASYSELRQRLAPARERGMRLAIDDAGAGYSGLQHIVQLQPDIIKLDMSLTRDIDKDPARRALASALIYFGRETGSLIVAEGVETPEELQTLRWLGVPRVQGYLVGRPSDLAASLALLSDPATITELLTP